MAIIFFLDSIKIAKVCTLVLSFFKTIYDCGCFKDEMYLTGWRNDLHSILFLVSSHTFADTTLNNIILHSTFSPLFAPFHWQHCQQTDHHRYVQKWLTHHFRTLILIRFLGILSDLQKKHLQHPNVIYKLLKATSVKGSSRI